MCSSVRLSRVCVCARVWVNVPLTESVIKVGRTPKDEEWEEEEEEEEEEETV